MWPRKHNVSHLVRSEIRIKCQSNTYIPIYILHSTNPSDAYSPLVQSEYVQNMLIFARAGYFH